MSGARSDISENNLAQAYARLKPPKSRTGEAVSGVPSHSNSGQSLRPGRRGQSNIHLPPSLRLDEASGASAGAQIDATSSYRPPSRSERRIAKRAEILQSENWLLKRGHTLTYTGVFLFTLTLYFRPYELFPALSGLSSLALVIAIATLLVFLPTQFASEGNVTVMTTEVKCVLFLVAWGILTMPIARDPALAWQTFVEVFSKVVLMFIIMVNTLRTPARIKGLVWLAIGVGLMVTYQAIDLYLRGEFKTEGYRVSVDFGGMFGNPNDLAMHLAIVTPLAIVLALASKNFLSKIAYFSFAAVMMVGNMVTQSRGGFLGLVAAGGVLTWKLGRRKRLKAVMILLLFGVSFLAFAPNNYGVRILSIFDTSLDPVGSTDQRTELLKRSILVTLRNPQGIGLGNFPVVGQGNRQTHNSYTQVSSELGWLCFAAYLIFLLSPFRKLSMIERELDEANEHSWNYFMAIGVAAALAAYMASSFFGSVAYHWYAYYPIAFAICLRRLHAEWSVQRSGETGV